MEPKRPENAYIRSSSTETTPSVSPFPSKPSSLCDTRTPSPTGQSLQALSSSTRTLEAWSSSSTLAKSAFQSNLSLDLEKKGVNISVTALPIDEDESSNISRPACTNFDQRHAASSYRVDMLDVHDNADLLPNWKRRLYQCGPLLTILATGAYFCYFGFRIYYTVSAQRTFHKTYVLAWLFIIAEGFVAVPTLFHNIYSLFALRGRQRAKLRLLGDAVPTVDVFVTCCKEDVDLVLDTTRAACAVDYPRGRFRVIVCDDGADPALKSAVEALVGQYSNLYYHARKKIKGVPHNFKAGNLIDATRMVGELPGGAGEFIAALDADMIPEPDWLRAIIAHMIADSKLGLACPPQMFYNIPVNDPLVQSLDGFINVMEPIKDANGVAWCTGSGYGIRREALESIGGWPTGSLAEDVFTSSMLLGAGWKTAFIHEPLQFGTVPDTFTGHLKQRTRWTLGTLQTALKLKFCLSRKLTGKMTFTQRLSGFIFTIDAFFKIFLLVALLTIPIVLMTGGTMVAYANTDQLRWQIRLCLIFFVLNRVNQPIAFGAAGYRLTQLDAGAQLWMAPYHAITIIQSFLLPAWLGGKPMAFSPSGSLKSELNERDPAARAPLWRRLKVIVVDCKAYIHLLYVAFTLAAVAYSTAKAFRFPDARHVLLYLVTHAFWPPVLWILCLTAAFTPLRYAIWPPDMPDREHLLVRDEKTQVAYPKPEFKRQRWARSRFWQETQITMCTLYTLLIFVASFVL